MGGDSGASGGSAAGMPRRGRDSEEEGGASRKRTRLQDAADSQKARGLEESRSILSPVTVSFSMRCDAVALAGRKTALEAALRKVAAEFGGLEFRLVRTRVGPSDDTLQRTLALISSHVTPEDVSLCFQTCRAWRRELDARGFCRKTWQLCLTMATSNTSMEHSLAAQRVCDSLMRNALRGGDARAGAAEHAMRLDAHAFLQSGRRFGGSIHQLLQAASQEPDASFLASGAASTAEILGLPLIKWAAKPQERYRGLSTLVHRDEPSKEPLRVVDAEVRCLAVSPDGTRVVSGLRNGTVSLWADEGSLVWTRTAHNCQDGCICLMFDEGERNAKVLRNPNCPVEGHAGALNAVAFSPDGKWIVSGADDNLAKIWDTATGAEVCTLTGHAKWVRSVAFSPDGTRVVTGSNDTLVKMWDVAARAEVWTSVWHDCQGACLCSIDEEGRIIPNAGCPVACHYNAVFSVAFSSDGTRVVSGASDPHVIIWDAKTGATGCTLTDHTLVFSAAFSPDGKRVVTAANGSNDSGDRSENLVEIWDVKTKSVVCTLKGHAGEVYSVAFSPDGTRVVSGADELVKLWNAETGAELLTLSGHSNRVMSISFSPDGKRVVSGSADGQVKIWDVETVTEVWQAFSLPGHVTQVRSISFSNDGRWIVSGSTDTTVKIWNAATGAEVCTLTGHMDEVDEVTFSPDGTRVVSASRDNTVKIWDVATGAEVCTMTGHSDNVLSIAFSPDGKRVVSGSKDNRVKLWDTTTGTEVCTLRAHSGAVRSVIFSPDGTRVVSGSEDETVKIWDHCAGAVLFTLGHAGTVNAVAISPDGNFIASGSDENLVMIWNAKTGAEVWTMLGQWGHESRVSRVTKVEFSSDSALLFTGSDNEAKTVLVWDVASGKNVWQVYGCNFTLVESANKFEHKTEKYVLTLGGDTVFVTELKPQDLIPPEELVWFGEGYDDSSEAAPVAFFKVPRHISVVKCHGATICVGCTGGAVVVLQAPFLAA